MAKAKSGGTGTTTIPPSSVDAILRDATGLPPTFFITMTKAKVLTDGSLEANYSFSTEGAPPAPLTAEALLATPIGEPDGDI